MKIAVIGHPIKTNKIAEIAKKIDTEDEIFIVKDDGVIPSKEMINQINECQNKVDVFIFTGIFFFSIISKEIIFNVPVSYVPKDVGTFLITILEAMNKGYDIGKVSIDSYDEDLVDKIFCQVGIPTDRIHVQNYSAENVDEYFLENEFSWHYDLYSKNEVSLCLTGISDLYEMFNDRKIPAMLFSPTDQIIETTLINLKQQYLIRKKAENDVAILLIEINNNEDESLMNIDDYNLMLEKLKIEQKIYLFSYSLFGAIHQISTGKYIIVTTKINLNRETENLTKISLLDHVRKNTMCTLSIGIGFGETAREANQNSNLSLIKAKKNGFNCAYIQYDSKSILGPIYCIEGKKDLIIDDKFLKIAKETGVSVNSVFKLSIIMNKYEKNTFTINELAHLYGVSDRSMYRMIEKLENANYAVEVGQKIVGKMGRPSRIMELKFNI